mgnify:FL=1
METDKNGNVIRKGVYKFGSWMRNKNKNIMLDLEKITLKVREIALRAGAFLRKERSGFDRSR